MWKFYGSNYGKIACGNSYKYRFIPALEEIGKNNSKKIYTFFLFFTEACWFFNCSNGFYEKIWEFSIISSENFGGIFFPTIFTFYWIFITKYFWSNSGNFPQLRKVWSHYAPHLLSLEAGLRLHSEYARWLRLHAYMHAFPLALARVIEPDQLGAKLLLLQTLPTREDVRPFHLYK